MSKNVLVVHGGGPTPVINASLYGVIEEAEKYGSIDKVYGALGGTEGILKEEFFDLKELSREDREKLLSTPATAIGSSRFPLYDDDFKRMPEIFKKYDISYVLLNGGNGTMDTCGKMDAICREQGITVVGIPKTVDNDIAVTDHTPGFGSAARYLAVTTSEIGYDVKSLPIHVSIIEAMGRNAGWITASSALARKKPGDAPHLIYVPERPFDEEAFLRDVKRLHEEKGGVVVVASEGLKNKDGEPIVPPIFKTERAVYYGDVGTYLAELVVKKLGIKARSEKPGIAGRCSIALQSPVDREEAVLCGREALKSAIAGEGGVMIGLERIGEGDDYAVRPIRIPVELVMMYEKKLPDKFINEAGNNVTEDFVKWCRPLIGPDVPDFTEIER